MRQDAKRSSRNVIGTSPGLALCARVAALFACIATALLATGCGSFKVVQIDSTRDFQHVVLEADKPVLVEFWRAGCQACETFAPIMGKLADEYDGRAVIAGYQLMSFKSTVRNQDLRDRYQVFMYPTVILFVNGTETGRWVAHYEVDDYRKALDAHLSPTPATRGK